MYRRTTLAALLAVALSSVFGVGGAAASTPCDSISQYHCFAGAQYTSPSGVYDWGASADMDAGRLSPANTSSVVVDELWVGTDNSNQNLSLSGNVGDGDFVGTGLASGAGVEDCAYHAGVEFFWEYRSDAGMNCHDVSSAKTGTQYPVDIAWAGNNTWRVFDNNNVVGDSTGNPCCSRGFSIGTESSNNSDLENSFFSDLEIEHSNDTGFTLSWPGSTPYWNGNMAFQWSSQYNSFSTTEPSGPSPSLAHAPAAATNTTGSTFPAVGSETTGSAPPALAGSELAAITKIARAEARAHGESSPTRAQVVRTTRLVAERVSAKAIVNTDPGVYFVVIHGHFTSGGVMPMPPGQASFTGTVLELTISAATNRITDVGITNISPNVHRIGVATRISLSNSGH
jgi:hypothetical protein